MPAVSGPIPEPLHRVQHPPSAAGYPRPPHRVDQETRCKDGIADEHVVPEPDCFYFMLGVEQRAEDERERGEEGKGEEVDEAAFSSAPSPLTLLSVPASATRDHYRQAG